MIKRLLIAVMILVIQTSLHAETPTEGSVTKLYVSTFNRAPLQRGLDYWVNRSNLQLEGIAQSFFDQEETQETYPPGTSNADFVAAIFMNMFGHPNTGDYWVDQLNSGVVRKDQAMLAIMNGATGDDATMLVNKTRVGLAYANAGLTDKQDAADIMLDITDDVSTVNAALLKYGLHRVNKTFMGSLASEESNYYTFTATSTGAAFFRWNSANSDILVYIYESTNPDEYTYDHDGLFDASIEEGRTYTVQILNNSNNSIDAYYVDFVTTNDSRGDSVAMVPNKSYTDTVNDQNSALRVYNFTANSTGRAYARADWVGAANDATMFIYEDGIYRGKAYSYDSYTTMDTGFDITEDSKYTIVVVFTYTSQKSLDYTFEVATPDDSRGDTVALTPNTHYNSTVNTNDNFMDVYNFTANSTGRAYARADWVGVANDAIMFIYEDGIYRGKAYSYDSYTTMDTGFDITEGSKYTIVVFFTNTSRKNLDYTFEVATTDDSRGDTVALTPNTHYNSTVNTNDNFMDVYNFTANSTGRAYARADWVGAANDAIMFIYEDGIYRGKAYSYDSYTAIARSFDITEDSKYTIVVFFTNTSQKNLDYTFEVATTDDSRGDTVALTPNTHYNSTVNTNDNFMDVYNFTANSTGSAYARADWVGTANNATMFIYEDGIYRGEAHTTDLYRAMGRSFDITEDSKYTIVVVFTYTSQKDLDYTFKVEI